MCVCERVRFLRRVLCGHGRPKQTDGAVRSRALASRSPATGAARAVDLAAASHAGLAVRRANGRGIKSSAAHVIIKVSELEGGHGGWGVPLMKTPVCYKHTFECVQM